MKAAVLTEQNKPLEIIEVVHPLSKELTEPSMGFGHVLVDMRCASICGAQLGEISGAAGPDKYLPHMLGHEGAGIIAAIGEGVSTVTVGDHVVLHWRKGRGLEGSPAQYHSYVPCMTIGGGPVHTFAEHVVVSENRVTRINKDVPFEIASLMGCAVTTGFGLVNNEARLKIGQSIAVAGVGGVGLSVCLAAHLVSADPVIAIDIFPDKLSAAMACGATHTINVSERLGIHKILKNDFSPGVDVFVDFTGDAIMVDNGILSLAPGGKMILAGQPHHSVDYRMSLAREFFGGKTIMDSQGGLTDPDEDIPRYLRVRDRLVKHRPDLFRYMIGKTFALEDINGAIDWMKNSSEGGRAMLVMNDA